MNDEDESQLEVSRNPHASRPGARLSGFSGAYADVVNAAMPRHNMRNNS